MRYPTWNILKSEKDAIIMQNAELCGSVPSDHGPPFVPFYFMLRVTLTLGDSLTNQF